jgi:hypothetical protein
VLCVLQCHPSQGRKGTFSFFYLPSQEPQNVTQNNTPHCASPKEKSQKNLEVAIGCSTQKIELNEKMKAKEGKTSSPKSTEEAKQVDSSIGMLQQTMGNVLKSIGDGLSTVAKK